MPKFEFRFPLHLVKAYVKSLNFNASNTNETLLFEQSFCKVPTSIYFLILFLQTTGHMLQLHCLQICMGGLTSRHISFRRIALLNRVWSDSVLWRLKFSLFYKEFYFKSLRLLAEWKKKNFTQPDFVSEIHKFFH